MIQRALSLLLAVLTALSLAAPAFAEGEPAMAEEPAAAEEPVEAAEEPVEVTEAPVETTEVPVEVTEAPVEATEVPVEVTEAPVEVTEVPVEVTEAPVEATEAPVEATEAPVEATEVPVEVTEAPTEVTEAPVETTEVPVVIEEPVEGQDAAEEPAGTGEAAEEAAGIELEDEAISGVCGDYVTWTLSGTTLIVSGFGDMWNYSSYGSTSYDSVKNLIDAVVIEDSVTRVGNYAFSGCPRLTNVTVSSRAVSIGTGAFEDCTSLAGMTIPASVTSIGSGAFAGCTSLTSLEIWNGDCEIDFSGYYYDDVDATLGRPGVTAVTCYAGSAVAEYAQEHGYAVKTVFAMDPPKNIQAEATAKGIRVTWKKVPGAGAYRVFYKEAGSEAWSVAGDSTGAFTWTQAKSGKSYSFTVRCLDEEGGIYLSSYDQTGSKSLKYIAAPKVKLSLTAKGIKVSWDKVAGAAKYRVFYKTSANGKWIKIGDTTSAGYTRKSAKLTAGKTYWFTVRCVSKDGKSFTSPYDEKGVSTLYLAAPTVKTSSTADGIKVSWNRVKGASAYMVYYKKSGETSWHKIGATTDTSYTRSSSKLSSGSTYYFTVRCTDAKKNPVSAYQSSKALKYIAAPKISSLTASGSNGIKITWGKVNGAAKYRVFCRTGSGGWTTAGDTTGTSFTWTKAKIGVKYYFSVRCLSKDGKTYTSAYDTTGKAYTLERQADVKTGVYLIRDGSRVKDCSYFKIDKKSGNTIQFSAWWTGPSAASFSATATLSGNKATISRGEAEGYFTISGNTITLKVTKAYFTYVKEGTFTYTYFGTQQEYETSIAKEYIESNRPLRLYRDHPYMMICFNKNGTVTWDEMEGSHTVEYHFTKDRLYIGGNVYKVQTSWHGLDLTNAGKNDSPGYLAGEYSEDPPW